MDEVTEEASGDISSMLSDDVGSFNDERNSSANHRFVSHINLDVSICYLIFLKLKVKVNINI